MVAVVFALFAPAGKGMKLGPDSLGIYWGPKDVVEYLAIPATPV